MPTAAEYARRKAAIAKGSELDALAAMREHLSEHFIVAPVQLVAQIAPQIVRIMERESFLKDETPGTAETKPKSMLDELKKKREARNGDATPADRAPARRRGGPKRS